jgi:HAD superfamily hydrolase (TIGR01509 family)
MSFAERWGAAIFDFDGTLVDSMGIWDRICRDWLVGRGKAPEDALERDIEHMTLRQSAEYVMERYGAGPKPSGAWLAYGNAKSAPDAVRPAPGNAGAVPGGAWPEPGYAGAAPGGAGPKAGGGALASGGAVAVPGGACSACGNAKSAPDAIIAEWLGMVRERYERDVLPKPGALAYLRALRASGVKLAIATSCFPEACEAVLRKYGARDLFSAIAYTDEAGDGDARDKRLPGIWLLCAKRLGARPEECAVFEDMRAARAGAKAAGMAFVAVADASNAPEWALMRAEADCAVESFERPPAAIAAG